MFDSFESELSEMLEEGWEAKINLEFNNLRKGSNLWRLKIDNRRESAALYALSTYLSNGASFTHR